MSDKKYKCDFQGCDKEFKRNEHLKNYKVSWYTEEGHQGKKKSEEYTAKSLEKEDLNSLTSYIN